MSDLGLFVLSIAFTTSLASGWYGSISLFVAAQVLCQLGMHI